MARGPEHLGRRALLDDHAEIHYRDPVADVVHGAEIVRDQQIGGAGRLLNLQQQVDDLGARRWVERRGRLVEHDHRRVGDDRAAMPTRCCCPALSEVRYWSSTAEAQIDAPDHRFDSTGALARRQAERLERLLDRTRDPHARIERLRRLLEDQLNLAAQMRSAHAVLARELLAPEQHPPAGRLLEAERRSARSWSCRSPNSPTSASVSPRLSVNETPLTACTFRLEPGILKFL